MGEKRQLLGQAMLSENPAEMSEVSPGADIPLEKALSQAGLPANLVSGSAKLPAREARKHIPDTGGERGSAGGSGPALGERKQDRPDFILVGAQPFFLLPGGLPRLAEVEHAVAAAEMIFIVKYDFGKFVAGENISPEFNIFLEARRKRKAARSGGEDSAQGGPGRSHQQNGNQQDRARK
jgi:hypothetical protein